MKLHTAKTEYRLDYIMHFCEYGFLTFLTFLWFAGSEFKFNTRKIILITLSLMLFAFLDELHQKLIPGRTYNIRDILSNESGIIVGTVFVHIVFGVVKNRLRKTDQYSS
jgi:VanZ family protein